MPSHTKRPRVWFASDYDGTRCMIADPSEMDALNWTILLRAGDHEWTDRMSVERVYGESSTGFHMLAYGEPIELPVVVVHAAEEVSVVLPGETAPIQVLPATPVPRAT